MPNDHGDDLALIKGSIQGMPPGRITGWSDLAARQIRLIGVETEPSRIALSFGKFHVQFRAELELTEDLEGKIVTYRAFVPGEASGLVSQGEVMVVNAQLDAEALYMGEATAS